jgi:hypothetical protein
MQCRRCRILPILVLAIAPGCQAFYQYRPVVVQARDAETKQPIAGATVHVSYPLTNTIEAPWDSGGTTGKDGIVRVKAAPSGDAGIQLDTIAAGYLTERQDLALEKIKAIEPAGWFEAVEKRPVTIVVDLYAGPTPTVEFVLPNGYRGRVKAEVEIEADAPIQPGQRTFRYEVTPDGSVAVAGPALLRRVLPPDFHARYADGTILTGNARDGDIGLWCLNWKGKDFEFLVGTKSEYDHLRFASSPSQSGDHRSSGGNSGGQGRRGRKGNQGNQGSSPPPDGGNQ